MNKINYYHGFIDLCRFNQPQEMLTMIMKGIRYADYNLFTDVQSAKISQADIKTATENGTVVEKYFPNTNKFIKVNEKLNLCTIELLPISFNHNSDHWLCPIIVKWNKKNPIIKSAIKVNDINSTKIKSLKDFSKYVYVDHFNIENKSKPLEFSTKIKRIEVTKEYDCDSAYDIGRKIDIIRVFLIDFDNKRKEINTFSAWEDAEQESLVNTVIGYNRSILNYIIPIEEVDSSLLPASPKEDSPLVKKIMKRKATVKKESSLVKKIISKKPVVKRITKRV